MVYCDKVSPPMSYIVALYRERSVYTSWDLLNIHGVAMTDEGSDSDWDTASVGGFSEQVCGHVRYDDMRYSRHHRAHPQSRLQVSTRKGPPTVGPSSSVNRGPCPPICRTSCRANPRRSPQYGRRASVQPPPLSAPFLRLVGPVISSLPLVLSAKMRSLGP